MKRWRLYMMRERLTNRRCGVSMTPASVEISRLCQPGQKSGGLRVLQKEARGTILRLLLKNAANPTTGSGSARPARSLSTMTPHNSLRTCFGFGRHWRSIGLSTRLAKQPLQSRSPSRSESSVLSPFEGEVRQTHSDEHCASRPHARVCSRHRPRPIVQLH
jgi:hypothetical protein